jgi:hypothetical protein
MAPLIDHLWQSILLVALTGLLCLVLHRNAAALRLWTWRLAALKFLLPFGLLYALGGWIGFPVRHNALPPPEELLQASASALPWVSPAQSLGPGAGVRWSMLALALLLTAACAKWIGRQLRANQRQSVEENARAALDWSCRPPPLGFLKSTVLAGSTVTLLVAPMLTGALHDRVRRQQALAIDTETLRTAGIELTAIAPEFGGRTRIVATEDGVAIHHVNLQDLVALVYGIDQFEVFGGALPWLVSPHYEVKVRGAVHAPGVFDPYALRQPITRYLNQQYGVSIRVNGDCQDPCLDQESFVIERIPWTLSKLIAGPK